jgi:hypothetical protein
VEIHNPGEFAQVTVGKQFPIRKLSYLTCIFYVVLYNVKAWTNVNIQRIVESPQTFKVHVI